MARKNIVAMIDIGSAETKVFIVELLPKLNIVGAEKGNTVGMSRGEIVNLGELKESVHEVIRKAERLAGPAGGIHAAALALTGMDLDGNAVVGLTSVKSENGLVSREDMRTAREDACARRVPEGRRVIQRIPRHFFLDRRQMDAPLERNGRELAHHMWVVDADETYLSEILQIPNRYGLLVENLFIGSLASAEAVKTFSEMDKNRLVIDIGAGTTDFVLFREGVVVCTGVIPVGGDHVTNDISYGLQIRQKDAGRLKIRYGKAMADSEDVFAEIDLDSFEGELNEFSPKISKYKMQVIVELRLRELFQLVAKSLAKVGVENLAGTPVFLTGGTSRLPGIAQLAGVVLDAEVRLAESNLTFAGGFRDPEFSTVVGMTELFRQARAAERASSRGGTWANLWRKLFR